MCSPGTGPLLRISPFILREERCCLELLVKHIGPVCSIGDPEVEELRISVGSSASSFAFVSIFAPKLDQTTSTGTIQRVNWPRIAYARSVEKLLKLVVEHV